MALDHPFQLGDWIRVPDGRAGRVTGMNWRSTSLLTKEGTTIVMPNGILAASVVTNLSRPYRSYRTTFNLVLSHEITVKHVERLLRSAVSQVSEVCALPEPEPRIVAMHPHGVEWEMRFWAPEYARASELRHLVQKAVLRNLHFAGITLAKPQSEVFLETQRRRNPRAHRQEWIERIELFDRLPHEQKRQLAEAARRRLLAAGMTVVRQGDAGESLFVLTEGALEVAVETDGQSHVVALLKPGNVFGEMSLLTGAPRAATVSAVVDSVLFEITADDLEPLLHDHPQVVDHMARLLAERQQANQTRREQGFEQPSLSEFKSNVGMVERMRAFFGI